MTSPVSLVEKPQSWPSEMQNVGDSRLRDSCLGDDLMYFFVAERRAEDVHADVGGDRCQPSHISGEKALLLDFLEEAFESARGERCREVDTVGTIGPPSVRTELGQKN